MAGNTRVELIKRTEEALRIILLWASVRGLKFSTEKSVMIPLKGGLVPGFTAAFGDTRLKSASCTKYLGIHFSAGLSFEKHYEHVINSSIDTFSRLKAVRKSKWGVSPTLASIIYKAVYIPRLSFGIKFWFPKSILRGMATFII